MAKISEVLSKIDSMLSDVGEGVKMLIRTFHKRTFDRILVG